MSRHKWISYYLPKFIGFRVEKAGKMFTGKVMTIVPGFWRRYRCLEDIDVAYIVYCRGLEPAILGSAGTSGIYYSTSHGGASISTSANRSNSTTWVYRNSK